MKCIAASLVVMALLPSSLSFFHAGSKLSKPKDDCHTVWEEVVTPRCKTTFEKQCTTEEEEKCKTDYTTECWEESKEKCKSVPKCHTEHVQQCTTVPKCVWEEEQVCEQVCHSKPVKKWKMAEEEEEAESFEVEGEDEEEHEIVKRQAYGGGPVFYQPQPVAFQPAPATFVSQPAAFVSQGSSYGAPAPASVYHPAPVSTFTSQGSQGYGASAPVFTSGGRVYRSAEQEEGAEEEAKKEDEQEGEEEEHDIVKRQAYGGGQVFYQPQPAYVSASSYGAAPQPATYAPRPTFVSQPATFVPQPQRFYKRSADHEEEEAAVEDAEEDVEESSSRGKRQYGVYQPPTIVPGPAAYGAAPPVLYQPPRATLVSRPTT